LRAAPRAGGLHENLGGHALDGLPLDLDASASTASSAITRSSISSAAWRMPLT